MTQKKLISRVQAVAVSAVMLASTIAVNAVTAADTQPTQQSAPISEVVKDSGLDIDYARALQYSLYFYDANMCGYGVDTASRYSWRGDCHTYDAKVPMVPWDGTNENSGTNLSEAFMEKYKDILDPDGDGGIDVSGGFHDAGDHVEFGMPENYTAATLGWEYYEYKDTFKKLEQDDHMETILRHFNDYLMRCTFRDKDGTVIAHCYQVGEGGIDHASWKSPEVDTMVRPAFFLTAEKPQTDYVVSACASLAINYLNFKDSDPDYAKKSLDYAEALWKFANDNPKELSDNGDGPGQFYQSSKWEDDFCWAAAWMYEATGDYDSTLGQAVEYFDYYAPSGWCYCWNDMWSGAAVKWAIINQEHPELDLVQKVRDAQGKNQYVFDNFWDDDCVGKCLRTWQNLETPQGFAFLSRWGSCRYNTAMQLICLLYDKYNNDNKPSEWSQWAKKQMNYVLGDNDITFKENEKQSVIAGQNGAHGPRSFCVGYNDTAVKNPHHRAASGLIMAEDPREQKHILWGALAGGPDGNDAHGDFTAEWTENEVTIDYNAAFPGACAGLYEYFGTPDMAITPDFPPEDEKRGSGGENGGGGKGYWIEAIGIDKPGNDGSGTTQVSFKVMSGVAKPSSKTSVRYYFNTSEMANGIAGVTKAGELYDQSSAEDKNADGILTGPFKYDKTPDTYYVEITWDGYTIANSGKKYQFEIGMYYGDVWDPENDWSYEGLKIGKSDDFFAVDDPPEEKTDHICVYDDGVLVGGIEPDGSTPSEDEPEVTTTTTKKPEVTTTSATTTKKPDVTTVTTTTTKNTTTVNSGKAVPGDVNLDGEVDMSDLSELALIILKEKKANDAVTANADVDKDGDITITDLSRIKQFISRKISKL